MRDYRNRVELHMETHQQKMPLSGVFTRAPGYRAMDTAALLNELDTLAGPRAAPPANDDEAQRRSRQVRNILMRIHRTFSLAMSALVFALVGVPLGMLARQAHMLSAFFLGCLPVMLLYYPVFLLGHSMADQELISVAAACWTPDGILGAIGAGLLLWLFLR
jgi:lipopolysaccharide export LptBFGC system permease protein LptF